LKIKLTKRERNAIRGYLKHGMWKMWPSFIF